MSSNDTFCVQVINAYSESSQLDTLCLDTNKYDINIVSGSDFYGNIATSADMDMLWVLVTGSLVFFMQTGFTMLEAGTVKIRNVQNILFKNMMDACVGAIGFYLFGYAVAYGDGSTANGFMGKHNVALSSSPVDWNSFFFQWAFAATSATIVSGSVAERCSLSGYFTYTTILTIWVYPVIVHWFWSDGGWLSPFNSEAFFPGGVIDFAGSGVVHMVGGWSGLMGAIWLGPRINRFKYEESLTKRKSLDDVTADVGDKDDKDDEKIQDNDQQVQSGNNDDGVALADDNDQPIDDGNDKNSSVALAGQKKTSSREKRRYLSLMAQHELGNSVPLQVIGCFILWFGWYGFNPGSTLAASGAMNIASKVAVTTTLSAASGGIVSSLLGRVMENYFSIPRVCNGILAGLVSITAGCSVVDVGEAMAIGVIGAFVYYYSSKFLERIRVDDPLDAWAVHGMCGAWGVISVGLFSTSSNIAFAGYNDILINSTKGYRLSLQLFAVFIIIIWVVIWIGGLFFILAIIGVLRVSKDIERIGLDESEHGSAALHFKKVYKITDKKLKRALSVFGKTSSAQSGSQSASSSDSGHYSSDVDSDLFIDDNPSNNNQQNIKTNKKATKQKQRPKNTPHIVQNIKTNKKATKQKQRPKNTPHIVQNELIPIKNSNNS